jgi:hypothetical protein
MCGFHIRFAVAVALLQQGVQMPIFIRIWLSTGASLPTHATAHRHLKTNFHMQYPQDSQYFLIMVP